VDEPVRQVGCADPVPGTTGVGVDTRLERRRVARAAPADVGDSADHRDRGDRVTRPGVVHDLPVARARRAGGVPALAAVVPHVLATGDPVVEVARVGPERRYEAGVRVARARRVGEGTTGRADLAERRGGAVRPAAVGGQRHVQADVLDHGPVTVVRIDEGVPAVAAERGDHAGQAGRQQRLAVVLQTTPDGQTAGDLAAAGVVVLEGTQGGVVVGPAGGVTQCAAVDATVVADEDPAAGQHDRVLVRVGTGRAGVQAVLGAGQREVPVRPDRLPGAAAVDGLVDLLQTYVEVVLVGRGNREELVVPGLHARGVPRAGLERRVVAGELAPLRDLVPRTGRYPAGRDEDTHQLGAALARARVVEQLGGLDQRVERRAVRRVAERGAADLGIVDRAG